MSTKPAPIQILRSRTRHSMVERRNRCGNDEQEIKSSDRGLVSQMGTVGSSGAGRNPTRLADILAS